jgi:hypothetical protein
MQARLFSMIGEKEGHDIRGNTVNGDQAFTALDQLQWGRGLTSAEMV